jgi:hypothetical protein
MYFRHSVTNLYGLGCDSSRVRDRVRLGRPLTDANSKRVNVAGAVANTVGLDSDPF